MPRNINLGGLTPTSLLDEAPAAAPAAEEPKGPSEEELANIDTLAQKIADCSAAAAEEKALRPQLLSAMKDANLEDRVTESGLSVKVITTNRDSFDEEGFIAWAKANGHADLVKTVTTEVLDMDAVEKLVYDETGDEKPITEAVSEHTSTSTSVSVRVTLPKAKKGKEAK